jgi:peptidyl-prolyl cis-trans isomerase SurA
MRIGAFGVATFSIVLGISGSLRALDRLDGICAVVGTDVILLSEVDGYVLMKRQALSNDSASTDSTTLNKERHEALEDLVNEKVLLSQARSDTTIAVTDQDVQSGLERQIDQIIQQRQWTVEDLDRELQKQQGMSLPKFKEQMRRTIRERMLKEKVQQKYLASIAVTRAEVVGFYERFKDSLPSYGKSVRFAKLFIDVATSDSVKKQALRTITEIHTQLTSGKSFEEVLKGYSADSMVLGGDLGFIEKGSLSEIKFEQVAFSLKPGDISDVFETRLGYHVMSVTEKKEQKVHVLQVLVKTAPSQQDQSTQISLLDSVRAVVHTEKDFAAAVSTLSSDAQSKGKQGDIGWQSVEDLPLPVREAFDSIAVGVISRPIAGNDGLSLLRCTQVADDRPITLESDYELLAEKTREFALQNKLMSLIQKWRATTYIDIRL